VLVPGHFFNSVTPPSQSWKTFSRIIIFALCFDWHLVVASCLATALLHTFIFDTSALSTDCAGFSLKSTHCSFVGSLLTHLLAATVWIVPFGNTFFYCFVHSPLFFWPVSLMTRFLRFFLFPRLFNAPSCVAGLPPTPLFISLPLQCSITVIDQPSFSRPLHSLFPPQVIDSQSIFARIHTPAPVVFRIQFLFCSTVSFFCSRSSFSICFIFFCFAEIFFGPSYA